MCRLVLAILLLLLAPASWAQAGPAPFVITAKDHNINPQVAFSPDSNTFLVVWVQAEDIITFKKPVIYAAQLRVKKSIREIRQIRISRPYPKTQAPFASVVYHGSLKRFLVLWQEIDGEEKTLMLTTVDNKGKYVQRVAALAEGGSTLLSAPLLAVDPDSGLALAAYTGFEDGKVATAALSFDPAKPCNTENLLFTVDYKHDKFDLLKALIPSAGAFRLLSFRVNQKRGRCSALVSLDIEPVTGPIGKRLTLTRKRVRRSTAVSAARAEDEDEILISYDQTSRDFDTSSVAMLKVDSSGSLSSGPEMLSLSSGPEMLTPQKGSSGDAVLLPAAADGLARILWLVRAGGGDTLKLQAVTDEGQAVGEPLVVRTTTVRINSPAMAYGKDGTSVLVVWSEDSTDGGVNLLACSIAL